MNAVADILMALALGRMQRPAGEGLIVVGKGLQVVGRELERTGRELVRTAPTAASPAAPGGFTGKAHGWGAHTP